MKIVVFGKSGQVATELQRQAEVTALGRGDCDFARPDAVRTTAEQAEADLFINAAAYTAVDKAEAEEDAALTLNATSPGALADVAAARGIPLLHISTDYVFDGSGTVPWPVDAPTGPLGAYGRTKLAGEEAVRAAAGPHAILRTSWVFSAHGSNFMKTMLRLGADRPKLTIVADQVGGPTPAADIAATLLAMGPKLADGGPTGTYHYAGTPDASWADFAREIFAASGLPCVVEDIPTKAYPTPAKRPANSRLNCSTLARDYGIERPDWKAGIRDVLKEL